VGFGTPVPLLVGIILIVIGIGLFFLDNFKPGYKRDSDTVYAILFMLTGLFALLSWGAEFQIALQFMISAGTLTALMIERIQTRTPNSAQGRQPDNGMPYRDDPRPNRSYRGGFEEDFRPDVRAELDDEPIPIPNESSRRRIRGSREGRGSATRDAYTQDAYLDQLSDNTDTRTSQRSSRRSSRSSVDEAPFGEERSRRRPLQLGEEADSYTDIYSANVEPSTSTRRRGRSVDADENETSMRSKRRRPRPNTGDRPIDGDYVDYKPLDPPKYPGSGDEFDNSSNFDDEPQFN
jgi:hypothetical protein